jgi:hypothetical protein
MSPGRWHSCGYAIRARQAARRRQRAFPRRLAPPASRRSCQEANPNDRLSSRGRACPCRRAGAAHQYCSSALPHDPVMTATLTTSPTTSARCSHHPRRRGVGLLHRRRRRDRRLRNHRLALAALPRHPPSDAYVSRIVRASFSFCASFGSAASRSSISRDAASASSAACSLASPTPSPLRTSPARSRRNLASRSSTSSVSTTRTAASTAAPNSSRVPGLCRATDTPVRRRRSPSRRFPNGKSIVRRGVHGTTRPAVPSPGTGRASARRDHRDPRGGFGAATPRARIPPAIFARSISSPHPSRGDLLVHVWN